MNTAGPPHGDAHIPVDTDKIVGGSKLLGEMRDLIRRKHYSIRTEQAYLLPPELIPPIRNQMAEASQLHQQDLVAGLGEVYLPYALVRKYPNAAKQWGWQYYLHPRSE